MGLAEDALSQAPTITRLVTGAVLLLSGFGKLADLARFSRILRQFPLVPPKLAAGIAVSISALEVALGGWLVVGGDSSDTAAAAAAALFLVFAVVLAIPLLRGHRLECGCFGRLAGEQVTWATVVRSVTLAGFAATTAVWVDGGSTDRSSGVPALIVVAALVVGGTLLAEALSVFHLGHSRRGQRLALDDADHAPRSPNLLSGGSMRR